MGRIIRFTHKKCGFEYDFFEGKGFSLSVKESKAREYMRNGEWGEHWQKRLEEYPEGTATFRKALCYCEKCKKYFTKSRISFYIPKEGFHYDFSEVDKVDSYTLYYHYQWLEGETVTCPICDSVAVATENPKEIPCPMCGQMRPRRPTGFWD